MNQVKHVSLRIGGRDLIAELAIVPQGAMVAIRPICEAIGLQAHKQIERLDQDPRFNCTHMGSVANDGKERQMACLPVEQIGAWLYSINSNKVKTEARAALLEFQLHLTKELNEVVFGNISSEKTAALEKQVQFLAAELVALRKEMQQEREMFQQIVRNQQQQIDYLTGIAQPLARVEKHMASIGGKFMAAARGTKKMRDSVH